MLSNWFVLLSFVHINVKVIYFQFLNLIMEKLAQLSNSQLIYATKIRKITSQTPE